MDVVEHIFQEEPTVRVNIVNQVIDYIAHTWNLISVFSALDFVLFNLTQTQILVKIVLLIDF